jgi:hypothetical protein
MQRKGPPVKRLRSSGGSGMDRKGKTGGFTMRTMERGGAAAANVSALAEEYRRKSEQKAEPFARSPFLS